jgi:exosortase A-associated hydrolase 2
LAPDGGLAVRASEGFLLPLAGGGRFCLHHPAAGPRGGIGSAVYIHPFAEEMNKSRRMAALQARALSDAGISVLQIDLMGCGDSAGDFGDATWEGWVGDVVAALRWMRSRSGFAPLLWGLRSGCLLATAAARIEPVPDLVFWQPVISGRQHLQQFLRLRVAGQLVGRSGAERTGTAELRASLEEGATLEIAGYALPPALALGLEAADLAPPAASARVAWFEVSSSDPPELSPAGRQRVAAWEAAGHRVTSVAVAGLAFWQTQEISECPALIDTTAATVRGWYAAT